MLVVEQTDWLLQRLVLYVNGSDKQIPITVSSDGLLISGKLVSCQSYLKHVYDQVVPKDIRNDMESIPESILKLEFDTYLEAKTQQAENRNISPMYLHLVDAKFHKGDLDKIIKQKGVAWRGSLEKVSGFYLDH